jgi:hypothetical protein
VLDNIKIASIDNDEAMVYSAIKQTDIIDNGCLSDGKRITSHID